MNRTLVRISLFDHRVSCQQRSVWCSFSSVGVSRLFLSVRSHQNTHAFISWSEDRNRVPGTYRYTEGRGDEKSWSIIGMVGDNNAHQKTAEREIVLLTLIKQMMDHLYVVVLSELHALLPHAVPRFLIGLKVIEKPMGSLIKH